jgi:NDP-sugar pyrophosphorylase family protein
LVPLGDKPVMEILIRRLKAHGFKHVTLCVGHLAPLIKSFFNNGKTLGIKIDYSLEKSPLGTVAPISLIKNLPKTFLVANGDLLTTANFKEMIKLHKKEKAALTVGTYKRHEKIELGVLEIEKNRVVAYKEKPEFDFLVSAGVYIFEKKLLKYIPKNKYFDFPALVNRLIEDKEKVVSYNIDGFWLDIGRPDDYQKAIDEYSKDSEYFLSNTKRIKK